MMFQFHCYKQTAPPGLYSLISGGIRTVVSHKAGTDKQNLCMPPQESLNLTPMRCGAPCPYRLSDAMVILKFLNSCTLNYTGWTEMLER